MYRIGEFSKMTKTTIKALRYYDEVELLKPERVDKYTGYRFYTTNQLFQLHRIQGLRQVGLSIDEIKLIINGQSAQSILEKRKREIEEELASGAEQLSRIEFILSGKEEKNYMNYQAMVKELPKCIVYSKEMIVPNYDAYFKLIPAIGEKVINKYPDLNCITPEYCFIRYLDGEYKETDIRVEFCEAIDKKQADFDDIKFKEMGNMKAISVMHKGSYQGLSKAYAYVFKWIEENGYTVKDSPRESYIDGIWNKDREEDWLTELQVPIENL